MTFAITGPEAAFNVDGYEIFHTYIDDCIENPPSENWFEFRGRQFDMRDLPKDIEWEEAEDIIRNAMILGLNIFADALSARERMELECMNLYGLESAEDLGQVFAETGLEALSDKGLQMLLEIQKERHAEALARFQPDDEEED